METDNSYTTVRVKRQVKFDIERISAQYWKNTGEKLDAGQVVEKAIAFFIDLMNAEKEKAQVQR